MKQIGLFLWVTAIFILFSTMDANAQMAETVMKSPTVLEEVNINHKEAVKILDYLIDEAPTSSIANAYEELKEICLMLFKCNSISQDVRFRRVKGKIEGKMVVADEFIVKQFNPDFIKLLKSQDGFIDANEINNNLRLTAAVYISGGDAVIDISANRDIFIPRNPVYVLGGAKKEDEFLSFAASNTLDSSIAYDFVEVLEEYIESK